MRIGIDISPLMGGHAVRGTGIYTKELLSAFKSYSNLDIVQITQKQKIEHVDLIHYPFFDPFFVTLPLRKSTPTVVTVHDLIPIAYADHFPRGIKGEIKWQLQKLSIKGVQATITDSQASKKDIIKILQVPPLHVHSIPLAPSPFFKKVVDITKLKEVITKYSLPDEFLLYVGDVNWNKNVPGLLRAIKNLNLPLVLVGKAFLQKDLEELKEINGIIEAEELHDRIVKLGFVSSDDLSAIYTLARLTLCVSYAEGFGFTVLESMACGTPCVVSNCSSLQEIAGPSITVDPWNVSDIGEGIKKALTKEKRKEETVVIEWAKQYSWKKVIEDTTEVYKQVLGTKN